MLRAILATNASIRLLVPLRTQLAAELLNAGQPEAARDELRLMTAAEQQAGRPFSREQKITTDKLEGLTFLRDGEVQNCLSNHNSESCLPPLTGGGIHRWPAKARLAVEKFAGALALKPNHLEARWLLNIAAMSAGDYPEKVPPPWRIPPAAGGSRIVHHTVSTGGSFGANPIRQELGLGSATNVLALDLLWPGSGTHQTLTNLPADHFYRLHEDGGAEPVPLKRFTFPSGLEHHSGHPPRKSTCGPAAGSGRLEWTAGRKIC